MSCFKVVKILMFVLNFIIFMAGCGIIAVSVFVQMGNSYTMKLFQKLDGAPPQLTQLLGVGYLLIALGSVLVLIGFLGCCGAVLENRCMLMTFFVIVTLVFIGEATGGVMIMFFRHMLTGLMEKLSRGAVKSLKVQYGVNKDITSFWNFTMTSMKCCGYHNFSDFSDSVYSQKTNRSFPPFCCKSKCDYLDAAKTGKRGCYSAFITMIKSKSVIILAVAFAFVALELAVMVLSMTFFCQITRKRSKV